MHWFGQNQSRKKSRQVQKTLASVVKRHHTRLLTDKLGVQIPPGASWVRGVSGNIPGFDPADGGSNPPTRDALEPIPSRVVQWCRIAGFDPADGGSNPPTRDAQEAGYSAAW
jgi:hypothetical protein